jgi:L-ascorbate metabolism protein UlaG (beta-lactamase superfamily)
MEFQFYGGNCIRITTKQASIVVDDNLKDMGGKSITKPTDIALFTHLPASHPEARLVISDPGEYEVSEVSIFGLSARAHMDEPGKKTATIFRVQYEDTRVAILGHIYPDLHEDQLEEIGTVDILITPVGGNGYTLDATGAMDLIKKIEPKIVIPTYYADKSLNFEVPAADLQDALKNMALEVKETLPKYKPKFTDYGETAQIVILEKQ